MIDGVKITALKKIPDERGCIMHAFKSTEADFEKFGEAYFSKSYPGVVKGWHLHSKMDLNYVVVEGMVKLVLYDDRKGSKTFGEIMELFIGEENYCRVHIPKGIWNGYKTYGKKPSLLLNIASIAHDPSEMSRVDPFKNKIPYNWELVSK